MESIATTADMILRRLTRADLVAFQAYRNDPDIARYQGWAKMDDEAALGFLEAMEAAPLLSPGAWCQIAIARPSDDLLIGDMGWFLSSDATEVELGITLARAHHGKGIATQAMREAVAQIFARTAVPRIVAYADVRNAPSCALLPRAGFVHIGTEVTDGVTERFFEHRRHD